MSKNRKIPFGYCMKNGEITTAPNEAFAVGKIFESYVTGKSLLEIAKDMQNGNIPYDPDDDRPWNKNMVKRILENEKYLGDESYPQIVSERIFHSANERKKKAANNLCVIPEDMKILRNLIVCEQCGKRLFRNQNGTWSCKAAHCGSSFHSVTDDMIISDIINILNMAIADVSLLDADGEISIYYPDGNISRQINEINRLMDSADIEYDRIKTEIFRLAEMKYDCCKYDDVPQKTEYLKSILSHQKKINDLDDNILKKCVKRIIAYNNSVIEIEFINGVKLRNEVR